MPDAQVPPRRVAEEFRQQPLGHHSPELQRVLTLFRGEAMEGKFVLVSLESHKKWALGQLSGVRGEPVTVMGDVTFDSRSEAEWEIFKRRWEKHCGEALTLETE